MARRVWIQIHHQESQLSSANDKVLGIIRSLTGLPQKFRSFLAMVIFDPPGSPQSFKPGVQLAHSESIYHRVRAGARRNSWGAVPWRYGFGTQGAIICARDRSPPGLHRSWLPRTDGPLLADSLEGARSVGAVRTVSIYGRPRLRGTAALQASADHRCRNRMDHCRPIPGGRPLRRRREMMLIFGRPRLRGTAALQA